MKKKSDIELLRRLRFTEKELRTYREDMGKPKHRNCSIGVGRTREFSLVFLRMNLWAPTTFSENMASHAQVFGQDAAEVTRLARRQQYVAHCAQKEKVELVRQRHEAVLLILSLDEDFENLRRL